MQWAGKAEPGQGVHGHHPANRDRGSEMQTPRPIPVVEKEQAMARLMQAQQLEAVLEIAF
jgi:hypothetical protein